MKIGFELFVPKVGRRFGPVQRERRRRQRRVCSPAMPLMVGPGGSPRSSA
jgi:hypothetical protein